MTDFTIFYFHKILRNDVLNTTVRLSRTVSFDFLEPFRCKIISKLKNDVTNKISYIMYTFVELLEYQMNANT